MIYITQLIYLKEGQEEKFLEFESFAIPLMEKYTGKMIYRLRPSADAFVGPYEALPYEIHFLSFDSQNDLNSFMKDDSRLEFVHLKDESVRTMLLVKGEKM